MEPGRNHNEPFDWQGMFIFSIALLDIPGPLVLSATGVLLNYDCAHFLLEQYILPNPHYRSMSIILLSYTFRLLVFWFVCIEACRTFSFFLFTMVITLANVARYCSAMLRPNFLSPKLLLPCHVKYRSYYIQLTLLYKKVQTVIYQLVYMSLSVTFWILLASVVFTALGYEYLSPLVLFEAVSISIMALVMLFVTLPAGARICCNFLDVTNLYLVWMRHEFAQRKYWRMRIALKQAIALAPVKVPFGHFYLIDYQFVANYFSLLSYRVFDAIFLLKL